MRLTLLFAFIVFYSPLTLVSQKQMDSTVFYRYNSPIDSVRTSKMEFSYYSTGLKSKHVEYLWDTLDNYWILRNKSEFFYRDNEKLLSLTDYYWIRESQTWQPYTKLENVYVDSVNQVNEVHYSWDWQKKDWVPVEMWERRYGIGNKCIMTIWADWHSSNNRWYRYYKEECEQDPAGNLITQVTWRCFTYPAVWTKEYKIDNMFDSSGHMTSWLTSAWVESTGTWQQFGKGTMSYDSHGNQNESLHWSWDTWTLSWRSTGGERRTSYYYSDGRIYLTRLYNYINGQWHYSWEKAFKYFSNIHGNLYLTISYSGNPPALVPNYMYESFLYADGHESYEAYYTWSPSRKDWHANRKEFSYFSKRATGIEEPERSVLSIYPNPVVERITITGLSEPARVMVFSANGRLVQAINQITATLDLSDLPPGFYYLVILQGSRSPVWERMIKQ